jgi:hypothetical protein
MQNKPCHLHTFKLKNGAYKPSKMYDSQKLNFNKLWVPKYLNGIRSHTQKLNLKKKYCLKYPNWNNKKPTLNLVICDSQTLVNLTKNSLFLKIQAWINFD